MRTKEETRSRSDRVSALAKHVRTIKDRRQMTVSQIASEVGVEHGRIAGLFSCYCIRAELEPMVVAWVERNS